VTELLRSVLLYDGGCRLCRWSARVVAGLDRGEQLALLPLEDEEAQRLLEAVPEDRRGERFWLVLRDGTPVPGDAGGGVAVLSELRLTRPLGRALRALRAGPLVDAVDKLVSRHRSALGRVVPDGPAPRRFP
jgi:predicted DCC family thiol-disulfide oxidoreductase YuxK